MKTKNDAEYWAQKLVDFVVTATQLDPELDQLPNVEDWKRNAKVLFEQVLKREPALPPSKPKKRRVKGVTPLLIIVDDELMERASTSKEGEDILVRATVIPGRSLLFSFKPGTRVPKS